MMACEFKDAIFGTNAYANSLFTKVEATLLHYQCHCMFCLHSTLTFDPSVAIVVKPNQQLNMLKAEVPMHG